METKTPRPRYEVLRSHQAIVVDEDEGPPEVVCSFCAKQQKRDKVVRGPRSLAICAECVELAAEVLADQAR